MITESSQSEFSCISQSISCKNHPESNSGYFITEEPWIKYCKNCALNVALCGRKIEKDLTQQQFDKKMLLTSTASEMKRTLHRIPASDECLLRLSQITQRVGKPILQKIKYISEEVSSLLKTKQKLQSLYETEISQKIAEYLYRQTHVIGVSMQVKKELQLIESNYENLIEIQHQSQFQEYYDRWNTLINNMKIDLIKQGEFQESKRKLGQRIDEFNFCFKKFEDFKIQFKPEKDSGRHKQLLEDDSFDMILTPQQRQSIPEIDIFECMQSTHSKMKAKLKLRTNRKENQVSHNQTDRQFATQPKAFAKIRTSLGDISNLNNFNSSVTCLRKSFKA